MTMTTIARSTDSAAAPRPCRRLLLVAGVLLAITARAAAADAPRWNILFVFADDWGRYAGCYRGLDGRPGINDVVETPALDRLAREGVVFRNAFVNAPSCTPCRSSLLSGRYFFNCGRGAILQGAVWDDSIPTFPLELERAGYRIGKSFKVWSPGQPADQPFGGQRRAFEKAGRMSGNFSESATRLVSQGSTVTAARDTILAQVRGNFDDFLVDATAGGGDAPWLYFLGTTTTHRRWVKGSGQALWGIDPERLAGRMPAFLPDVPEVREDVADYLGEVRAVDAALGVLLDRLAATGQLDRTLVIVSGDHGMPGVPAGKCDLYDHGTRVPLVARVPGGIPGRTVDDFVSLPDLAPTFMEIGGVAPPPGIEGRSILPLLRSDRSGQIDPERTWVIIGRERHVAAAREGRLPYPMRAIRTADHLYIRNFAPDRLPMGSPGGVTAAAAPDAATLESDTFAAFADMDASPTKAWVVAHRDDPRWSWLYQKAFGKRPAEELYDLRSDPDQLTNVADDPDHAAAKERLSRQLTDILTRAGDPRLAADVPFERPPFTDASR
jgi:arylsulfatase A-like enzyme